MNENGLGLRLRLAMEENVAQAKMDRVKVLRSRKELPLSQG